MDIAELKAQAQDFHSAFGRLQAELGKVIVGQAGVVEGALTALFAGGHVLLEGVPGLGKTELVKALGRALDLAFGRIQFTPDLMPADIIGTQIMAQGDAGAWGIEFRQGPIFTQLLLADEINRATPKTQSALLETMQEGTVTVGGRTHALKPPFCVLATQNPLEQEGTYPLPEAQLDRFMFKLNLPYLDRVELNEVVTRTLAAGFGTVDRILDGPRILALRAALDQVVLAPPLRDYAVRLVLATHPDSACATDEVKRYVRWGASPRAAQALLRAGRVRALSHGRAHLGFEDIRHFAVPVLQHRVLLNYDGQAEDLKTAALVTRIVEATPEEAP